MDPHSPDLLLASYESTENALSESFRGAALKVTNLYRESALSVANSSISVDPQADNHVVDSYKAAAHKVTMLYKDALVQNRKAYAAGYQQALQDLYGFISSHPRTITQPAGCSAPFPIEHGYLPVQDVLGFARLRNAQLTTEMIHGELEQQTHSAPCDTRPNPPMLDDSGKNTLMSPSVQQTAAQQDLPMLTHLHTTELSEPTPTGHVNGPKHYPTQTPQTTHDPPFISCPRDISRQAPHLAINTHPSVSWESSIYHEHGNDSLKRRHATSDSWIDPHPSKRGRR